MTAMLDHPIHPASQSPDEGPNARTHPHRWIGSATVDLTDKLAKHANLRGSYRTSDEGVRINVLEVYCRGCRRAYDDVHDGPCEALINNEHLIGGNPGERKKRGPQGGVTPAPGPRSSGGNVYQLRKQP